MDLDVSLNDISENDSLSPATAGEADITGNDLVTYVNDSTGYDDTALLEAITLLDDHIQVLHNDINLLIGIILLYIFYLFAKHISSLILGRRK